MRCERPLISRRRRSRSMPSKSKPVETDRAAFEARVGRQDTKYGSRECGLAAAGFANQSHDLAAPYAEVDGVEAPAPAQARCGS